MPKTKMTVVAGRHWKTTDEQRDISKISAFLWSKRVCEVSPQVGAFPNKVNTLIPDRERGAGWGYPPTELCPNCFGVAWLEDKVLLTNITTPSLHRGMSVITGECHSDCFASNKESRDDQDGERESGWCRQTDRDSKEATEGRKRLERQDKSQKRGCDWKGDEWESKVMKRGKRFGEGEKHDNERGVQWQMESGDMNLPRQNPFRWPSFYTCPAWDIHTHIQGHRETGDNAAVQHPVILSGR